MTAAVSWVNTLQKLGKDLDESDVDLICLYPILPHIGFEDYQAAAKMEPRIIPFTSMDLTLSPKEAAQKLLQDVKHGARGLKIHPILQPVSLRDPFVEEVLHYWAPTRLPVVSHCGVNSYYPEEMKHHENPDYGNLDDFIFLVERLPQVNFVAAHAGGLTGNEAEVLAQRTDGARNLWVDTTFRSAEAMRQLVELFGEDRVLFGVDRPFGRTDCSVQTAFKAFGKYTPLSERVMYTNAAELLQLI
jgi:predicted TIM-barrel fold metal-dependent hydrolase